MSDAEIERGDRVIDRDDEWPTPARVVSVADETAEEYHIDAVGKTVAQCNPEYPPGDPVVGIPFGDDANGPTYHYPVSRLQHVSQEWEPDPAKTNAQREREATIEQNRDAFEAFRHATLRFARHPERSSEYFERKYDPGLKPETRGGCRFTREDEYRPNDAEALVCWECNGGGRRPRKLHAGDDVPQSAPCRTEGFRSPHSTLKTWFGEEIVAGNEDPRLTRKVERAIEPNPGFSRLQRAASDLVGDEENFRRSAVVRIAYEATLGGLLDEDYNHSRALAYLRDLGVDTNALLPGGDPHVGAGGGGSR